MRDEFGSERNLAGVANDEPRSIFENNVHLAFARRLDLNLDKNDILHRPRLGRN